MTTGGSNSNPGNEKTPDCDICTLLQFIAEEVIALKERLNLFETQFGDFDSQNAWRIRMGLYP